jgi:hypothetical protein
VQTAVQTIPRASICKITAVIERQGILGLGNCRVCRSRTRDIHHRRRRSIANKAGEILRSAPRRVRSNTRHQNLTRQSLNLCPRVTLVILSTTSPHHLVSICELVAILKSESVPRSTWSSRTRGTPGPVPPLSRIAPGDISRLPAAGEPP